MTTALQLRETDTMDEWAIMREQAAMLVTTGFLPQAIKTPEQAVAIILTGRELGIGTMAALNNISVIQGKPTVSPQLMLALINRTGQVEDLKIEAGADGATCTIKRRGRSAYTARFGPKEAQSMGLAGKDNYKKQPATMYKWRAVAEAVRFTFSDVTLGLYTPEEMGAQADLETGQVIEITPEPLADEPPTMEAELTGMGVTAYAEPEPEPVRPVKLEGAQPTQAQAGELPTSLKGQAGQVVALAKALKWGEAELISLIQQALGAVVYAGKLAETLEFMTGEEHRELIRVLKGKLQGGR